MAETERDVARRRRRAPDPVALISGLVAVFLAGYALAGNTLGFGVNVRWAAAMVAVLAGLSFILLSLRNPRTGPDD